MLFFFSLLYALFCAIVIYPPAVFVSAGLTGVQLLSSVLGSESESFVQYQIRRSCATILLHCCLPLGYTAGLLIVDTGSLDISTAFVRASLLLKILWTASVLLPLVMIVKVLDWSRDNWSNHPICKKLTQFCGPNTTWMTLASNINTEYKSIDKIYININGIKPSIVTNTWIIQVDFYTLHFARQSEAVMVVKESDSHYLTPTSGGEQQFINIEVKNSNADIFVPAFNIRINSLDFKDLQRKVSRPIVILPHIVFHKTVIDKFIDVFKEQISLNEKYISNRELEPCFGCMQNMANVKIFRRCRNPELEEPGALGCELCRCKPMWCVECMARWFGTRQDAAHPEMWLENKCTCPLCRQIFCILDVCYVELSF